MQRKKGLKSNVGSVAIVVSATLFAFYIVLLGLYARATYVRRSQLMADLALKSYYEIEVYELIERAQNSAFGWRLVTSGTKNPTYANKVAKFSLVASDGTYNVGQTLINSSNFFNGNFKIGYINSEGKVEANAQYPNAVYTDYIATRTMQRFKVTGQNNDSDVVWIEYDANGNRIGREEGSNTYKKKGNASSYVRVMWKNGLTIAESEKIMIYSTYQGDKRVLSYTGRTDKIKVYIGSQEITDQVNLTVYSSSATTRKKEVTIEIRDFPMEGNLMVEVAEKTVYREVKGKKEYNFKKTFYPGIRVSDL